MRLTATSTVAEMGGGGANYSTPAPYIELLKTVDEAFKSTVGHLFLRATYYGLSSWFSLWNLSSKALPVLEINLLHRL